MARINLNEAFDGPVSLATVLASSITVALGRPTLASSELILLAVSLGRRESADALSLMWSDHGRNFGTLFDRCLLK